MTIAIVPVMTIMPTIMIAIVTEIMPVVAIPAAPMGVAPAAVPVAAVPAEAFAAVPGEIHPAPAVPEMPAAAIPEIRLAIVPAIIVRAVHGNAAHGAVPGPLRLPRVRRPGGTNTHQRTRHRPWERGSAEAQRPAPDRDGASPRLRLLHAPLAAAQRAVRSGRAGLYRAGARPTGLVLIASA